MLLIFAGPTYGEYIFSHLLKFGGFPSAGIGLLSFIVGIALMIFLIRKKLITV